MSQKNQPEGATGVEDVPTVDGPISATGFAEPSPEEYVIEDHELICSFCHGTGINIHKPGREPCPCCDGEGVNP